jgi:Aspartyl protease
LYAQSKRESELAEERQAFSFSGRPGKALQSAEGGCLRMPLIKLNNVAKKRRDRCRRQSKNTRIEVPCQEGGSCSGSMLGVAVSVSGVATRALVDTGCEVELLLSRSFADRVGIDYEPVEEEIVELPDGTLLPVSRTKELQLVVGPMASSIRAVVT